VKRARFVVLRKNTVPSTLVEGGFLTHRIDGSLIESESYREKLAGAVMRGIQRFIAVASGKGKPQLRAEPQNTQLRKEDAAASKPPVIPAVPPAPPKTESKPEASSPAKTDTKPSVPVPAPVEAKPEPKPAPLNPAPASPVKPEPKPEAKPEPKAEPAESKPVVIPAVPPLPPAKAEPAPAIKMTVPAALEKTETKTETGHTPPPVPQAENTGLSETRRQLQEAVEAAGAPVIETMPPPASPAAPVPPKEEKPKTAPLDAAPAPVKEKKAAP
jgi:ribonuclease E